MSDPPLIISVARTPEQLHEARSLRYEIDRAQGMIGPPFRCA